MASVTVVVPTCNRPDQLRRLLAGLAGQRAPALDWDVVVVDNAGPDRPAPDLGLPVPSRWISESRPGAAHARNRGLEAAGGTVVAFLDDDVVPAPGWLVEITAPVLDGRADAAGGPVVLDPSVARPAWLSDGITGYLAEVPAEPADRILGPKEFVVTANAAFRAERLRECGGFDAALGPAGRAHLVNDDVAVSRRIVASGGRLAHAAGAVVVHELPPERLRPGYLLRRAWYQGRSDWIVDAAELSRRRMGGARVATSWLTAELARRAREGPWRPAVAFHGLCDLARTAGALREAVRIAVPASR